MQLTNRAKKTDKTEMSLFERSYLPSLATGLGITIRHFFMKKPTIQYPEQKRYLGPIFRGHHILKRDEEGREGSGCVGRYRAVHRKEVRSLCRSGSIGS